MALAAPFAFPTNDYSSILGDANELNLMADLISQISPAASQAQESMIDPKAYFIQSKSGNIYIDVGGVTHRIKLCHFRPSKTLPCSRLPMLFKAKTEAEALKYCDAILPGRWMTCYIQIFYNINSSWDNILKNMNITFLKAFYSNFIDGNIVFLPTIRVHRGKGEGVYPSTKISLAPPLKNFGPYAVKKKQKSPSLKAAGFFFTQFAHLPHLHTYATYQNEKL